MTTSRLTEGRSRPRLGRRRPDVHAGATRQRARLAVLISAQFVVMLDTSIVNVALPSIQHDLGLSRAGTAWVVNTYFLAFGGFLLVSGRIADLLGRRRMFLLGSALVALSTTVAGLAADGSVLIAARALQGLGAAALAPAAFSILLVQFPGAQRAKAMSAWGAASALGGATGVLVGGLSTAALGWPSVFFLTLPISLLGLLAGPRLLDRGPSRSSLRGFDALGAAAVTGAALAVIVGTLSVADHGWTSRRLIVGLGAAAILLATFVVVERRATAPIIPLELFGSRRMSIGIVVGLLGGAARASTFFLVALYLQQVMAMSPRDAGLAMVPTSLAGFAVSLLVLPRALRALGPGRTLTVGLAVLGTGHLWLARTPAEAGYLVDVLPGLLLAATGVALSFTPSAMVIASAVPIESAGLASGLANASSQIGAALGIAAFSAISALSAAAAGPDPHGVAAATGGFHSAFTAAAVVALTAAVVSATRLSRGS